MDWMCTRCELPFRGEEPRCPQCLRLSTVRAAHAAPSTPGREQEAPGPDWRGAGRVAAAAVLSLLVIAVVLLEAGDRLERHGVMEPAAFGLMIFAGTFVQLAGGRFGDFGFGHALGVAAMNGGCVFGCGAGVELLFPQLPLAARVSLAVLLVVATLGAGLKIGLHLRRLLPGSASRDERGPTRF